MRRRFADTTRAGLGVIIGLLVGIAGPSAAHNFGEPPDMPAEGGDPEGAPRDDPQDPPETCDGDPISPYSGKWFYQAADLEVPGVFPIRLVRRYDSITTYQSPLGARWAFEHDWRLFEYSNGTEQRIVIRNTCGRLEEYTWDDQIEVWSGDVKPGWRWGLAADGNGGFILTAPGGEKRVFDDEGRLVEHISPQGAKHVYEYDEVAGKVPLYGLSVHAPDPTQPAIVAEQFLLKTIREILPNGTDTGRSVSFEYDPTNNRLKWAVSHDGRQVTYTHEEVQVGADMLTTGRLLTAEDPVGIIQTFGYQDPNVPGEPDDPHLVTSLQDGQGMEAVVNDYDAEGRVETQTFGDSVISFIYEPAATDFLFVDDFTDVDPNYDCASIDCRVTHREVHNSQGMSTAVTAYKYDLDGYPVETIDAVGNTRRTKRELGRPFVDEVQVYHQQGPVGPAPNRVLQKTIDLNYDAGGNLHQRIVSLDTGEIVTEEFTYEHGWLKSQEKWSSYNEEKKFGTHYEFYYPVEDEDLGDPNSQPPLPDPPPPPVAIKQVKRISGTGTFEVTGLTYDAATVQVAATIPPAVAAGDGLKIIRTYYGAGDTRAGLLETLYLEVNGGVDSHLSRRLDYDAAGFLSSMTDTIDPMADPPPNEWLYVNDAIGRRIQETEPMPRPGGQDDPTARVTHLIRYHGPTLGIADPAQWPPGRFLTETERGQTPADGEGQVRRFRYDDLGRLVQFERKDDQDQFGLFESYAYDSDGNRTSKTDAENRTTGFGYDFLGRLSSVADAASPPNVTSFGYDAEGNRILLTNALQRETAFVFDNLDRLIEIERRGDVTSDPIVTQFVHDAGDNRTLIRQLLDAPPHQETTYAYDTLSQLLSVTQPLGETVTYRYDERGRLWRTINARGQVLEHDYEPWGGLSEINRFDDEASADQGPPTRTTNFAYDRNGNLRSTADTALLTSATASGSELLAGRLYSFTYDHLSRASETLVHYLPQGGDVSLVYGYDRFGNRDLLDLGQGQENLVHSWTYKDLGRLTEASFPYDPTPSDATMTFDYWANDDLKQQVFGNGVTTDYAYHEEGPIDTIVTRDASASQLQALDYEINELLNVTDLIEEHAAGTSYMYSYGLDAFERLWDVAYPSLVPESNEYFAYDSAGNRDEADSSGIPASTSTYNLNNEIQTTPDFTYTFDEDGNIDTRSDGTQYTFDAENRLERVERTPEVDTQFFYDPFGRRIRKENVLEATSTWFVSDGQSLLAEYQDDGTRNARYIYAHGIAPIRFISGPSTGESVYEVHSDKLGSPQTLTDELGSPVWRAAHSAFGRAHLSSDPDSNPGTPDPAIDFNIRYPGQYFDDDTQLHYNWFRYYDAELGRYLSPDPIGQSGGINLYEYAQNDPVGKSDPMGLCVPPLTILCGAAATVGGTAGVTTGAAAGTVGVVETLLVLLGLSLAIDLPGEDVGKPDKPDCDNPKCEKWKAIAQRRFNTLVNKRIYQYLVSTRANRTPNYHRSIRELQRSLRKAIEKVRKNCKVMPLRLPFWEAMANAEIPPPEFF